jgi:parallel beta-helix repeat protein
VTVSPGTYSFSSQILVKPGRTLQANVRGQVVLRANPGFSNEILVTEPLGANAQVTVRRLVLDGASNVNGVIGAAEMIISDNEIRGAKCWGAAVAGVSVVISGNLIKNNGASCATAPPGTGIYVTANPGPTPNTWAPLISSNEIAYNTGPGIDINNGWGGVIESNYIHDNSSWAGVTVVGSYWTIRYNEIYQPSTTIGHPYHPECRGGPIGTGSAAIMLCQFTDEDNQVTIQNLIHDNTVASRYGILLIGADESAPYKAPRNNTLNNNVLTGSNFGCADDFKIGQWFSDINTWTGNNCSGPNTQPTRF